MSNYQYQTDCALKVLNNTLGGNYIAGVVSACPGAGKTTISFIYINEYVARFPNAKVLVLTHNMNVLKDQYLNDLKNAHVKINFTFGDFKTKNAQVKVGIPASIGNLDWTKIDLLVVDEAHEYWGEKMVTDIYKRLAPSHVLLLTGSPSSFIMHNHAVDRVYKNNKKYFIDFIAGSDLAQNNVFAPVTLDCVNSGSTTAQSLENALNRAKSEGYDMSKIMIACTNTEQANIVSYQMKMKGRKVALSTSGNDSDSEQFEAFLKGEKDVLVVVRRGILGFSDVNLTLVIDMKCSSDLDVRNQLFARALRKSPKNIRKAYITVPSKSKAKNEVAMLKKLMAFMDRKNFSTYMGV
jgi:hypothetical protein